MAVSARWNYWGWASLTVRASLLSLGRFEVRRQGAVGAAAAAGRPSAAVRTDGRTDRQTDRQSSSAALPWRGDGSAGSGGTKSRQVGEAARGGGAGLPRRSGRPLWRCSRRVPAAGAARGGAGWGSAGGRGRGREGPGAALLAGGRSRSVAPDALVGGC